MQKFEASRDQDTARQSQSGDQLRRAEQMKQNAPARAINWQAVFRVPGNGGGDGNKRVMGLHPDVTTKRQNAAGAERAGAGVTFKMNIMKHTYPRIKSSSAHAGKRHLLLLTASAHND